MTPRVVLVGLPGAGKSTTGRRLAKILAVPFADSDRLIEAREQRTVPELFATLGEPAYRTLEAQVISGALRDFDGVLALGGGALTSEATRSAVVGSAVPVVLLRARLTTLTARVGDGTSRPLLAGDPETRLKQLADERDPTFAAVATLTVDTDKRTPGQVAAQIAARLHDRALRG
jgi:shikimate kinase